jgi:hypothetical protein
MKGPQIKFCKSQIRKFADLLSLSNLQTFHKCVTRFADCYLRTQLFADFKLPEIRNLSS